MTDMEGHNIYQMGLGEGRIVRLLTSDADRQPVAVAFDELSRVMYWTDIASASIVSQPVTSPISIARSRSSTVYTAGIIPKHLTVLLLLLPFQRNVAIALQVPLLA